MPEQEMDVIQSLLKISKELIEWKEELSTSRDLDSRLEGAAFLLQWIANGLQSKLDLTAQREERNSQLPLAAGRSPWYGQPVCPHLLQSGCVHCHSVE